MKNLLTLSLTLLTLFSHGQKKKKQDISAIKNMCGCYEIKFRFAETFSPDKDYQYHDRYSAGALEWVFLVEESKDKIILQHLLVINDTMIIKHWRQDWLYENTALYNFHKERTWNYTPRQVGEVKGQWTQKVYQVDDSPRYEGSATWIHADGRHYWENTSDAPLPRREFSKRSDYNVMSRKNHQEITEYGWVHEQDNAKILRKEGKDKILAYEKGMNTYTKVKDGECQAAVNWWNNHSIYWADVRAVWDEVYATHKQIVLRAKVDDKLLFSQLFALDKKATDNPTYNSESSRKKIRKVIQTYLKGINMRVANLNATN